MQYLPLLWLVTYTISWIMIWTMSFLSRGDSDMKEVFWFSFAMWGITLLITTPIFILLYHLMIFPQIGW